MREILFRAKRIDNGEWVEGQYAFILNPLTESGETIPVGTVWDVDESTNNIGGEVHLDNDDEGWIEISRDTLEECFEEEKE